MAVMKIHALDIKRLQELIEIIQPDQHTIILSKDNEDTGIGYTLSATFTIIYNNIPGKFTTVITDENDW